MNDTIKFIFKKNILILHLSDRIIYYFRRQNFDAALTLATAAIIQIKNLVEPLLSMTTSYYNEISQSINNQSIISMLNSILVAQEKRDYVLVADLYEIQLIPFIIHLQEVIIETYEFEFDKESYQSNLKMLGELNPQLGNYLYDLPSPINLLDHGYSIEYSSCGLMTLALYDNHEKFYMHSNNRILNEALTLAASWYTEEKTEYIIYGLGLGYHIEALTELDCDVNIEIYESDINIIQLACAFSNVMETIKKPNIKLVYDPDFMQLMKRISDMNKKAEFFIHNPSLRNIKNALIREKLEDYFVQYNSIMNQRSQMNGNFNSNILFYNGIVDELKEVFAGNDLYIIAAGPSLDKNFLQLKEIGENSIIIASGTVFRKLINAGIRPDYVIVTDGNPRVYSQILDLEFNKIPMLLLSTAYKEFARKYQGKKYIIFQKDYSKAEEYAAKTGAMLFNTGGSVSTTALDIGIIFGCRRIIFLGLDLAYTDNYVHAADTSRRNLADTDDLRQVEDISGNLIYTSKSLDMYRRWIENRIKGVHGIEFIDATEGGAKIKGMKIKKLIDCIDSDHKSIND